MFNVRGGECGESGDVIINTYPHSSALTPCREDNSCFADSEFENEILKNMWIFG